MIFFSSFFSLCSLGLFWWGLVFVYLLGFCLFCLFVFGWVFLSVFYSLLLLTGCQVISYSSSGDVNDCKNKFNMEMFQIIYNLTSGLWTIRRNFFHRNCFTIQRPCGTVKGICIVLFPTTHREATSHFL